MHKIYLHRFTFPLYQNETRLNASLLDTLASLVELDLLASDQTLLQRAPDAHSGDGPLQSHWGRSVVEAAGRELVGLRDEGFTETAVVVGRNLATDTTGLIDVDQVGCRLGVDSEFACSASDFGGLCGQYECEEFQRGRTTESEKRKEKGGTYNLPDQQPSFGYRKAGQYGRHRTRRSPGHCLGHCTCAIPARRL